MRIVKLDDTQIKDAKDFLKHYKFIYVCNKCGSVYGTDLQEDKDRICHKCEVERDKKKREERDA